MRLVRWKRAAAQLFVAAVQLFFPQDTSSTFKSTRLFIYLSTGE